MNWDNQNKNPWGGKNDAPDFDDLVKKFSSILGGKKPSSNGSGGDSGGGFKIPTTRLFLYGLFAFSIVYASQSIYQLDASVKSSYLKVWLNFMKNKERG